MFFIVHIGVTIDNEEWPKLKYFEMCGFDGDRGVMNATAARF